MFTIDSSSNKEFYIIKLNGKEYVKITKLNNKVEDVKNYFGIEVEE